MGTRGPRITTPPLSPSHSWGGSIRQHAGRRAEGMPMSGILRRGWRAKIQVNVGKCGPKIEKVGLSPWNSHMVSSFLPKLDFVSPNTQLQKEMIIESPKKKNGPSRSPENLWDCGVNSLHPLATKPVKLSAKGWSVHTFALKNGAPKLSPLHRILQNKE